MTDTPTPPTALYYVDSGTFGEIVVREVAVEKITAKTVTVRHRSEWREDGGWMSRITRYSNPDPPGSAFARQDAGNSRDYYRSRDDALEAYCRKLELAAQSFRRKAAESDTRRSRASAMILSGTDDPKTEELKAERMAERVRDLA